MLYMVTFTINIPQMLAYIPYMDPMGYPVKKMSFFLGEEMAGFSPWVAFDLWNGRNGFWIEPNIIDGCVPGKHWMACLLMTNDFNRSPQTGILYTVCVYIYMCVHALSYYIYIHIHTGTNPQLHVFARYPRFAMTSNNLDTLKMQQLMFVFRSWVMFKPWNQHQ